VYQGQRKKTLHITKDNHIHMQHYLLVMGVDVVRLVAVGQVQGFPGLIAAARLVRWRGVLVKL